MNQKLPAVVAALALLVVVGIWWGIRSDPFPVVPEIAEPLHEQAPVRPTSRMRAQLRDDVRSKRDAWAAAQDQRRGHDVSGGMPKAGKGGSAAPAADGGAALLAQQEADETEGHTATKRAPHIASKDNPEEIENLKRIAISDPDPDERINALWSLSVSDEEAALPVLGAALRDENSEVRLAAVQELGGLDDERGAVDALTMALEDADPEIRAEAVRVIGDTDDPRAASIVERLTHDVDPDVRDEAQSVVESAE
jgi:hypothetical protein